jgi:hypothetical protein
MKRFFDLSSVQKKAVFHLIPIPQFLNLLTGKTSAIQIMHALGYTMDELNQEDKAAAMKDLATFYHDARIAFFERRDPTAYQYQSSLINSWVKKWQKGDIPPFLADPLNRKEWLNVLENSLNDPNSPLEHKIHCCLLINRLFPMDDDPTDKIVESIIQDVRKNLPNRRDIMTYASLLSPAQLEKIFPPLKEMASSQVFNWQQSTSVYSLGELMRYLSPKKYKELHTFLLALPDFLLKFLHVVMPGSLLNLMLKDDFQNLKNMFNLRLNQAQHPNSGAELFSASWALVSLTRILTDQEKRQVFSVLRQDIDRSYLNLDSRNLPNHSFYAKILSDLAEQLSDTHKIELLSNEDLPAHLQVAFADLLSTDRKNALFESLIQKLQSTPASIDQNTLDSFHHQNPDDREKAKIIVRFQRKDALEALFKLQTYLSDEQKKSLVAILYPLLSDAKQSNRVLVGKILARLGAFLNTEQMKGLVNFFRPYSEQDPIAALYPYLGDAELESLLATTLALEKHMSLALIVKTMLHIRHLNQEQAPVSNPLLNAAGIIEYRRYLSHEYDLTLREFIELKGRLALAEEEPSKELFQQLENSERVIRDIDGWLGEKPHEAEKSLNELKDLVEALKKQLGPVVRPE